MLAGPCSAPRSSRLRARAHTLVELLVTLGLAATLATLAAPTFRDLGADLRRDARVNELRDSLLLARAEALARGRPVVVCASADGRSCAAGGDWSLGWLAYAPASATSASARIAVAGTAPGTAVHANRAAVEFRPNAAAATTATLTVCDHRGARAARAVVVSRTGRVRLASAGLACA